MESFPKIGASGLPRERIRKRIKDLEVGEWAWSTPWTLQLDKNGNLWVNEEHWEFPYDEEDGPVTLKVIADENGYVVDISHCHNYQWPVRDSIEDGKPVIAVYGIEGAVQESGLPVRRKEESEVHVFQLSQRGREGTPERDC